MERLEEGNYQLPDWSLDVRCSGKSWGQKQRPCYGKFRLVDGDIVKRACMGEMCYGFICPDCHCFTEIDEKQIPEEVRDYCLQVAAKGSDYYEKLTEEEKKLSEVL